MGYFAQLDSNGVVLQVISVSNEVLGEPDLSFPETESKGQEFISNILGLPGEWKQTSFNGSFRGRFAGIGYKYDAERDQFISQKLLASWVLDESGEWVAPVPYPTDGGRYIWSESSLSWEPVE